eukprot:SAG31_NODE_5430_length_2543_cov_1.662848_1_plen_91_part_00
MADINPLVAKLKGQLGETSLQRIAVQQTLSNCANSSDGMPTNEPIDNSMAKTTAGAQEADEKDGSSEPPVQSRTISEIEREIEARIRITV